MFESIIGTFKGAGSFAKANPAQALVISGATLATEHGIVRPICKFAGPRVANSAIGKGVKEFSAGVKSNVANRKNVADELVDAAKSISETSKTMNAVLEQELAADA